MEKEIKNIMTQLEIMLEEYPEATFYIYNGIRTMVSDIFNSMDCVDELLD